MPSVMKKSLVVPDRVLDMDLGKVDPVEIVGGGVARATFEPGSKWPEQEKPSVRGGEERRPFWRTDGGP